MLKSNNSSQLAILVVEDEFLIRDNIVHFLRDSGCLVLEALSGEQAVGFLRQDRPIDVLFTDIRLSGELDGWDVGAACRATWPDIGVIYTSGHALEPARAVPGFRFFQKPYRSEQILLACCDLRSLSR